MIETRGDIFKVPDADAICFTSNGMVKANGELVMGAGIAKQFKDKFPNVAKWFGHQVKFGGNRPHHTGRMRVGRALMEIVSFPTKHDWRDQSDLKLIEESAKFLVIIANSMKWDKIYLPRPGCGLGGLDWETQVKPVIAPILDDRFYVLTP